MYKTIAQIFNGIDSDIIRKEIYRIIGWSVEHKKVHPVIQQYERGNSLYTLYASNDWWWFRMLTEEQKKCVVIMVKEAAGKK